MEENVHILLEITIRIRNSAGSQSHTQNGVYEECNIDIRFVLYGTEYYGGGLGGGGVGGVGGGR